jgi:hypothetical protein
MKIRAIADTAGCSAIVAALAATTPACGSGRADRATPSVHCVKRAKTATAPGRAVSPAHHDFPTGAPFQTGGQWDSMGARSFGQAA